MSLVIKIDQRKKEARALIEYLRKLSFVEIENEQRYNDETEKAIREARTGKGIVKTKSHEDLMKKLRS